MTSFFGGNAFCEVGFYALVGRHPAGVFRGEKAVVEVGRVAHVVGHGVDEVDNIDKGGEVDVFAGSDSGERQNLIFAEGLAQVVHESGEIVGVGRRGMRCRQRKKWGIPVDVDAVEVEILYELFA